MALYEYFYQLNKVIGSDKFYCWVGTIVCKYRDTRKTIAIWAINNFIAYKLLHLYVKVMSNIFCYYSTNNLKKLIDQKDKKNTALIATPILTTICIYIKSTKLLEKGPSEIEYMSTVKFVKSVLVWTDVIIKKRKLPKKSLIKTIIMTLQNRK